MTRLLLAALLAAALPSFVVAQAPTRGPDKTVDAAERKTVIDGILGQITRSYVFPDVATKMDEAIRARQAKGEYDEVSSGREFARLLTEHLQGVSKDKHLRVSFSPEPIPGPGKGPSAADIKRQEQFVAKMNNGFKKVERLDGGVGLLEFEAFMSAESIGETAAAAMTFLANSDAIIVDLRNNGGGDPAAVILLCSYFFDEQTHLNSIYNRPRDTTRQYWSHPVVPGKKLGKKDLYVLTSSRTFSGAEEFAYNMQSQKRGAIVGETTGGGAHPTRRHRITDHFAVGVPFARSINPVTKTNWEGTGVKPDVEVPAGQALHTAHLAALRKRLEATKDDASTETELKAVIARVEKDLDATRKGTGTTPGKP